MAHMLRVPTRESRYPISLRILVEACDGLGLAWMAQGIHMG
jgi:hypothetical protein